MGRLTLTLRRLSVRIDPLQAPSAATDSLNEYLTRHPHLSPQAKCEPHHSLDSCLTGLFYRDLFARIGLIRRENPTSPWQLAESAAQNPRTETFAQQHVAKKPTEVAAESIFHGAAARQTQARHRNCKSLTHRSCVRAAMPLEHVPHEGYVAASPRGPSPLRSGGSP